MKIFYMILILLIACNSEKEREYTIEKPGIFRIYIDSLHTDSTIVISDNYIVDLNLEETLAIEKETLIVAQGEYIRILQAAVALRDSLIDSLLSEQKRVFIHRGADSLWEGYQKKKRMKLVDQMIKLLEEK